ncbi:MAG: GTP-binding protein [Pseudomonadota bacterium]
MVTDMHPASIMPGFPGAGKTMLLGHIRHNRQAARIAVIANDMPGPFMAWRAGRS